MGEASHQHGGVVVPTAMFHNDPFKSPEFRQELLSAGCGCFQGVVFGIMSRLNGSENPVCGR